MVRECIAYGNDDGGAMVLTAKERYLIAMIPLKTDIDGSDGIRKASHAEMKKKIRMLAGNSTTKALKAVFEKVYHLGLDDGSKDDLFEVVADIMHEMHSLRDIRKSAKFLKYDYRADRITEEEMNRDILLKSL